ncbi:MAG: hypothetical protein INF91_04120 [Alphaproteobacteria bacterium]|nr:hypothetical protein [Alphaproteobacteria bacterium]
MSAVIRRFALDEFAPSDNTAAAADPEREAACAIARAEGFDAGLAAGRAEGDSLARALAASIASALDRAADRLEATLAEVADAAGELGLAAAEHLAGRALPDAPPAAAIADAVRQAAGSPVLRLTVHPDVADAARAAAEAAAAARAATLRIDVATDPSFAPGDVDADWLTGGLSVSAADRRAALLAALPA